MSFRVITSRLAAGIASAFATVALAQPSTWPTFNGDLRAQKYSPLTQITPANVRNLKVAWRSRTGDVSDGTGKRPATVWSATPLFVNDTVYVGTPFYRIIAYAPDTGAQKWAYDSSGCAGWRARQASRGFGWPFAAASRAASRSASEGEVADAPACAAARAARRNVPSTRRSVIGEL